MQMFGLYSKTALAAKIGYGLACVAAAATLVASGVAYKIENFASSIGGSNAISGATSTGAMNILVMGLESRTDYEGDVLPDGLLHAMHAGSAYGVENEGVGGQDTNTLILIHIFADGKKAVGFSIPRNDYVTYPQAYDGQTHGMIDQEYGLAYTQSLSQTSSDTGMSKQERYLKANEAGQQATIQTVESVTGVHVNNFAEINLAGFYALAQSFGGIEACLKSWNGGENLKDTNSGFDQSHAGYVKLSPAQTLAFVRERDNLPNGDLDRTRRQQAVIDYVIWDLEHKGVLSDIGQLTSLMNTAKQYIITNDGWNLLDFASSMKALSGTNLRFETLPIKSYATIYPGGEAEDINTIDVAAIQKEVRSAFNPPATPTAAPKTSASASAKPSSAAPTYPASDTVVDVFNAGPTEGLAGEVLQDLVSQGYTQGEAETASQEQDATQVLYGADASTEANAAKIAKDFGVTAEASTTVSEGTVEVILGASQTLPSSLGGGASAAPSAQASLPANATDVQPITTGNDTNDPLTVTKNAPYGIPCVY
jgi:LCP family protein required for cell wall assembly